MKKQIKNLAKAAKRVLKAIEKKERIIIYSDSDMDGITSAVIMKEAIENLGGVISSIYFPDREFEGYGINEKALFKLKHLSPCLLLSLDCGIGNLKEVDLAKKIGIEVVIIDHHEILKRLPKASIIVDPKQKDDKYPFKQFAAVGLVFKFAEALIAEKMSDNLRKSFLELAAMGTIADMMPRKEDNETIIIEGLDSLKSSWRPGLQVLFGMKEFESSSLIDQVNKVNSVLNIRDVENPIPAAFRVLTAKSKKEASLIADYLLKMGFEKRRKTEEIVEELKSRLADESKQKDFIVFEGSNDWDFVLLGTAASIISKRTEKPVFLYKNVKDESLGSVRAPSGFNTVEPMKKCSKLLITYGGHPQASGFRIRNENLEKFKDCLNKYFNNVKIPPTL
jgi:single-stranded-DNA-specific exonuclease